MSTLKNLDRLFTENFKEFEPEPPRDGWVNIQNKISVNHQEVNLTKNYTEFFSKIFYITASCCFVSITAGIANYIYYSKEKSEGIETFTNHTPTDRYTVFNDFENIHKIDFQNELLKNTELLNLQLDQRKLNSFLYLEKNISTPKSKNISKTVEPLNVVTDVVEDTPNDIVDALHVQNENMIVDESVGNIINEKDKKKINESLQVAEGTIIVTSNGNRVLRINSNAKTIDARVYNTKIDSTSLSADEIKLINQNKKKLKYKN